jgi:hypothetical protein
MPMRGKNRTLEHPLRLDNFASSRLMPRRILPFKRSQNIRGTARELVLPFLVLMAMISFGVLLAAKGQHVIDREAVPPGNPAAEYEAAVPKTIVELQQFRETSSIHIRSDKGEEGTATLINLNPTINTWYVLKVAWQNGSEFSYHLENPEPHSRRVILNSEYPLGIEILEGKGRYPCDLFDDGSTNALDQAKDSQLIYVPLCGAHLYLRNPVRGHRTSLEVAAEFLRNQVWGGEKIIILFHHLLESTYRETGEMHAEEQGGAGAVNREVQGTLPLPAMIDSKYANIVVKPSDFGLALEASEHGGMRPGTWYSASGNPGIYVSIIEPKLIDATILESHKATVNPLDNVEAVSLCYLVAFDLDRFDLAYALGTEHPAVDWSDHIPLGVKDPKLPGPDGIGTISPLVSTGLINPENARRTVATFTGGFKRFHGAFKFGEFALKNYGSHYGFLENGVVFSKLQPGLATIFVLDDGSIEMKTWGPDDDQVLAKIKYARQNGVPLVEFDERSESTVPGRLVNSWGPGNWSGSEDRQLRTIRSSAALQWNGKKRFLIYAVFSDATPSAMARVFQAYQCHYGMLLDMNALEHTYFALYRRAGSQLFVDHLLNGMSQVEKSDDSGPVPRFLGYPDNRDFFYLMRRTQ